MLFVRKMSNFKISVNLTNKLLALLFIDRFEIVSLGLLNKTLVWSLNWSKTDMFMPSLINIPSTICSSILFVVSTNKTLTRINYSIILVKVLSPSNSWNNKVYFSVAFVSVNQLRHNRIGKIFHKHFIPTVFTTGSKISHIHFTIP